MTRLRMKVPFTVATLWIALLLPALPAGAGELSGESERYSVAARLANGVIEVTIVHKASGRKVSSRQPFRATKLTEVRIADAEAKVAVFGEVGSRGAIQIDYDVNDGSFFDKIYGLKSESDQYSVSVHLAEANPTERLVEDEVLDITVTSKISGNKVSRRTPTRTAKLTEVYLLEAEQRLIVHGELGRRGDIVSVVDGIVVKDEMDVEIRGGFLVDQVQEGKPVLMAMPLPAFGNHPPRGHVQGGKQRGGAVADIVMGEGHSPGSRGVSAGCGPALGSGISHPRTGCFVCSRQDKSCL